MALRDIYGYTTKIVSIGSWDMDYSVAGTDTKAVAHGLSATEWKTIRKITTTVRNDTDTTYYILEQTNKDTISGVQEGGVSSVDSTNINLYMTRSGAFDNTAFDDTSALSVDTRGWVTFEYIAD